MSTENIKDKLAKTNGNNGNNGSNKPVAKTMHGMKSDSIKGLLEPYRAMIAQALPKHVSPERIINIAATTISRTPEIAECTTGSIIGGIMQASILGFELIPQLGQAYLVPFYNSKTGMKEAQFQLGYRGMIDLAYRTNLIKSVFAEKVLKFDDYEYELGLYPKLTHKPNVSAVTDKAKTTDVLFYYARVEYTNGGMAFVVMTPGEIEAIRGRSKASQSKFSPWSGSAFDYFEMAKKTCIRRLFKMMPTSVEYRSVQLDGQTIDVDKFMPTQAGEYDLSSIQEAESEISNANESENEENKSEDSNSAESKADQTKAPETKTAETKAAPKADNGQKEETLFDANKEAEIKNNLLNKISAFAKSGNTKTEKYLATLKETGIKDMSELELQDIETLTAFLNMLNKKG